MATIINTPETHDRENAASVWVVGLILIVLLVLFALFVWPNFLGAAPTPATPTDNSGNVQTQPTNNYNTIINSTSTTNNIQASTTLPI